jgi:predicted ATP-dependent endonuclease of OLD family
MIGYNGAGKTNVLNAIYNGFQLAFGGKNDNEFNSLEFSADNKIYKIHKDETTLDNNSIISGISSIKITENNEIIDTNKFNNVFSKRRITFIPFNTVTPIIEDTISELLSTSHINKYNHQEFSLPSYIEFRFLLLDYLNKGAYMNAFGKITEEEILNLLYFDEGIKNIIKKLTPIEDINIKKESTVSLTKLLDKFSINDFIYRFIVDEKELIFKSLSDGTKRIIASLCTLFSIYAIHVNFENEKTTYGYITDRTDMQVNLKLLLWEEPEIGLHPHQLFELMSIVKEQSKHKQILISTHSPIVLNCLDADELDRIIICEYKKGEGTKLRQLTEKEMDKARAYMKDVGFLSDYWMHSDLQKWQKNA